jgi:tetratricopeptide (TPR) repeat protein
MAASGGIKFCFLYDQPLLRKHSAEEEDAFSDESPHPNFVNEAKMLFSAFQTKSDKLVVTSVAPLLKSTLKTALKPHDGSGRFHIVHICMFGHSKYFPIEDKGGIFDCLLPSEMTDRIADRSNVLGGMYPIVVLSSYMPQAAIRILTRSSLPVCSFERVPLPNAPLEVSIFSKPRPEVEHALITCLSAFYTHLFGGKTLELASETSRKGGQDLIHVAFHGTAHHNWAPFVNFAPLTGNQRQRKHVIDVSPALAPSNLSMESITTDDGFQLWGRKREVVTLWSNLVKKKLVTLHGNAGMGKSTLVIYAAAYLRLRGIFPAGVHYLSLRGCQDLPTFFGHLRGILPEQEVSSLDEITEVLLHERARRCLVLDHAEDLLCSTGQLSFVAWLQDILASVEGLHICLVTSTLVRPRLTTLTEYLLQLRQLSLREGVILFVQSLPRPLSEEELKVRGGIIHAERVIEKLSDNATLGRFIRQSPDGWLCLLAGCLEERQQGGWQGLQQLLQKKTRGSGVGEGEGKKKRPSPSKSKSQPKRPLGENRLLSVVLETLETSAAIGIRDRSLGEIAAIMVRYFPSGISTTECQELWGNEAGVAALHNLRRRKIVQALPHIFPPLREVGQWEVAFCVQSLVAEGVAQTFMGEDLAAESLLSLAHSSARSLGRIFSLWTEGQRRAASSLFTRCECTAWAILKTPDTHGWSNLSACREEKENENESENEEKETSCSSFSQEEQWEPLSFRGSPLPAFEVVGLRLAEILLLQDRNEQAEEALNLCLSVDLADSQDLGEDSWVGQRMAYELRALARRKGLDFEGSEKDLQSALSLCEKAGDFLSQATLHRMLGDLAVEMGKGAVGKCHYDLSMKIYRQYEDRHGDADRCMILGMLRDRAGDNGGAVEALLQALGGWEALQLQRRQAQCLVGLGMCYLKLHASEGTNANGKGERGQSAQQAQFCLQKGRVLYGKLGDKVEESRCLKLLGWGAESTGREEEARYFYGRAQQLHLDILPSGLYNIQDLVANERSIAQAASHRTERVQVALMKSDHLKTEIEVKRMQAVPIRPSLFASDQQQQDLQEVAKEQEWFTPESADASISASPDRHAFNNVHDHLLQALGYVD